MVVTTYNIGELSWSNAQNYGTFLSTVDSEFSERLENWSVSFKFNEFYCPQYRGDCDLYLHNTINDNYVDLWFNEGDLPTTGTLWIQAGDTWRELPLTGGISNALIVVSNLGGRILIEVNGVEILDSADIKADIGNYALSDVSWSGNFYDWSGSTDVTVSSIQEAEFNEESLPLWVYLVIVAVVIALLLAWRAK